jgi:transcriptional regulator with XRE-family HTH domain
MAGMQEYGALIKSAREAKGMTIDDLSRALGRPTSFVWRIEQGKNANPPDPETTRQIWRLLSLPLRTQLIQLGYLDKEEVEPGIAYAVPEGSARAELLDALADATDEDVQTITAIARLVPKSGLRSRPGMQQSAEDEPTNRSA